MKILVLGAGLVGRTIALDLAQRFDVTAADLSEAALESFGDTRVDPLRLDASDAGALAAAARQFDLVVGAVPGFLGYRVIETVIRAGKDVVDISFFPEDSLQLHDLAVAHDVVAVVDAGVAPGLDNLILGHHDRSMEVHAFECLVGGLPKRRKWPFAYKAPFSPVDVIEEYTRPARYVEDGRLVTRPPLTDIEHEWFDEVGTLESFNTDGLRTLIDTMPHVPFMKEKTLRHPGHANLISALAAAGFFSDAAIEAGGSRFVPREVTSAILFDEWRLDPMEPEFTVMRVTVSGLESGQPVSYRYDLYDERIPETGNSSMARTTGFTCTAMAEFLIDRRIREPGVYPLERVGQLEDGLDFTLAHLRARDVRLSRSKD